MSAVSVAQLLGAPPSQDRDTQEQLNKAFAGMSKAQLYDVMREIKNLISGDRAGARQYFSERPWLTKVLFQGQILLGEQSWCVVAAGCSRDTRADGSEMQEQHVFVSMSKAQLYDLMQT